jgi:hypothetical protein
MYGVSVTKYACWLMLAATWSCRSHQVLCEGDECFAAGTDGGAAGAPAGDIAPPSMAGQAGQGAALARCDADVQCQNELQCDGAERCVDGSCEPGAELMCEHGTTCVEQGAERCLYETPSPWLLTIGGETVRGLPIAQLGERGLVTLVERHNTVELTGYDEVHWAPNGKVALLHAVEDQFGSSLQIMRFGAGLPTAPVDIPDVPRWGDFWFDPTFSADSKRALIRDTYSGTYIVDLTDDPGPTTLLAGGEVFSAESICQDSRYWVQSDTNGQKYVATQGAGEDIARALGKGSLVLSPDASLIALQVEDDTGLEVRLYSCSGEDWVVTFNDAKAARFSRDSKRLLLELTAGGVRVLSLEEVRAPVQVWASAAAAPAYGADFSSDGTKLLVQLAEGEAEPTLHVVDLSVVSGPPVTSLGLPHYAEVAAYGDASLLAWSTGVYDEPRDLLWQSLTPSAAPVLIYSDASQRDTTIAAVPFDDDSVFLERMAGEQSTLAIMKFDGELSEIATVATFPAAIKNLTATADGRGLAVQTSGTLIDNKVWWITFSASGDASEPQLLAEESLEVSMQPWP